MRSGTVLAIVGLLFALAMVYVGWRASRASSVAAREIAKAQYADEVARYAAWQAAIAGKPDPTPEPHAMVNPVSRRVALVGLIAVTTAFTAFGLGLWIQPNRWANTPSYGLLLDILNQQAWGTIHLIVAAMMAAAIRWPAQRLLVVTAHTAGIALAGSWFLAFVVRYITDSGTTVVNVVSWAVYVALVVQSALVLDDATPRAPKRPK